MSAYSDKDVFYNLLHTACTTFTCVTFSFKSGSSGLCRRVVLWLVTHVSEVIVVVTPCSVVAGYQRFGSLLVCDAMMCCGRIPTFRRSVLPPPSGSIGGLQLQADSITRSHNPEELELKHHRCESLKTRTVTHSFKNQSINQFFFFVSFFLQSNASL
jgi:hypothetical protein